MKRYTVEENELDTSNLNRVTPCVDLISIKYVALPPVKVLLINAVLGTSDADPVPHENGNDPETVAVRARACFEEIHNGRV